MIRLSTIGSISVCRGATKTQQGAMDCQTVVTNTDQAGSYMYATVEVSEKFLHNNGKLHFGFISLRRIL